MSHKIALLKSKFNYWDFKPFVLNVVCQTNAFKLMSTTNPIMGGRCDAYMTPRLFLLLQLQHVAFGALTVGTGTSFVVGPNVTVCGQSCCGLTARNGTLLEGGW
jgi:hypothetical protein